MRAKASFRVTVGRGGVEVVDIADGETLLFWEVEPRDAKRLARALREDLHALEAEDFLERWSAVQGLDDVG